jgi:hypothetical protein
MAMRRAEREPIEQALADLRDLTHVDQGVLEAIACGPAAVPRLRALLFAPEPGGLFETRCAVVEALAGLRAEDVLIAFLSAPHESADPAERAGTEAVMDAAARALIPCRAPELPAIMLQLAEARLLPGAIDWLGEHRRGEALACLVRALGDDVARPSAVAALRMLGAAALAELWRTVLEPVADRSREADTSHRRRRAALSVLRDIDPPARTAPADALEALGGDDDPSIAVPALCWLLDAGRAADAALARARLCALRPVAGTVLRYDIDACLQRHALADPSASPAVLP